LSSPRMPPKKRLGQHFLRDPNTARIVASGITARDVVLEVGPGRGFLTTFLAEKAGLVHAVEIDRDVIPALRTAVGERENVRLHVGDALTFDYAALEPPPVRLVANLPYNVASPLVLRLLEEAKGILTLRFMVQLEVARRMAARKGTKEYGSYAVLVQLLAAVEVVHKVSPNVFDPPPRVQSAVVEMRRRSESLLKPGEYEGVKRLTLAAFRSRRKRLLNNLPESARGAAPGILVRMGHGPDARAEELEPEEFVELYRALRWAL
jgi:16S rRNA (adenine1518-N6/adenine1519-N6)-dimethyltransferase